MLKLSNVSFSYKDKDILNNISFSINKGEIVALLGVNGAGKTTTLEIIEGILNPSNGSVEIENKAPKKNLSNMGVMFQELGFNPGLKVKEIISFYKKIYSINDDVESIINKFMLEEIKNSFYRRISGGQKQKVALAVAMMHNPKLCLLDEPTVGMDVNYKEKTLNLISDYVKDGGTVLLTTHLFDEVERLADRILILHDGKIVANETPESIKNEHPNKLQINLLHKDDKTKFEKILEKNDIDFEKNDNYLFDNVSIEFIHKITNLLSKNSIEISSIGRKADSLHQYFIEKLTESDNE